MMLLLALLALSASAQTTPYSKTTHTYKTVGPLAIQADVYRAEGDAMRPAIFWIHGGALISGSRTGLRTAQLERYLQKGFVVVSIDYRLAPETKLHEILADVLDAYNWLRGQGPKLFRIDPDRIGVVGHSAGGYLTLTCGYRLKPRPRALVSYYGYGDIAGEWYSQPDPFYLKQPRVSREEALASVGSQAIAEPPSPNPRGRFYLYCRQNGLWPNEVAGLDPARQARAFDEFCPARNVTRTFPPTLLLHGDADTDVPFSQSEQMAAELQRAGVEHAFIRVPGGPHGFDGALTRDASISAIFDRAVEFLVSRLR